MVVCWSVKGGVGTSVVSVAMAVASARRTDTLLIDLGGDLPAMLGLAEPDGPGFCEWLGADAVGVEAIGRLEHEAGTRLRMVHRGRSSLDGAARAATAAAALAADARAVVVDAGRFGLDDAADRVRRALLEGATRSILVLRPCYLALRRALAAPVRPDGIVLLSEPGRAISRTDVSDVLGRPVLAEIPIDPSIARAVDAGLLASRLPDGLARALCDVA